MIEKLFTSKTRNENVLVQANEVSEKLGDKVIQKAEKFVHEIRTFVHKIRTEKLMEIFILADINIYNGISCINVLFGRNKEERMATKHVALMIRHIPTDIITYSSINYLNMSWKIITRNSFNKLKRKKDSNGMVESSRLIPDYDNYREQEYLNVSEENRKKVTLINSNNVTLVVRDFSQNYEAQLEVFVLADINIYNGINYINLSVYINLQRLAPEAQLEVHSLHKRGLSGHPGSIPGWGASVPNFSLIKSVGGRKNE